jgi:hypothetical protein
VYRPKIISPALGELVCNSYRLSHLSSHIPLCDCICYRTWTILVFFLPFDYIRTAEGFRSSHVYHFCYFSTFCSCRYCNVQRPASLFLLMRPSRACFMTFLSYHSWVVHRVKIADYWVHYDFFPILVLLTSFLAALWQTLDCGLLGCDAF